MAIFRVNKTNDYTVLSNYHFKEKNMSLKAKGLLSLMLSLPDDWDYSIDGLVNLSKDGYDGVKAGLDELKQHGHLSVEKKFPNETKSGRIEYIYNVFEKPQKKKQDPEKQDLENLPLEFLPLEFQGLENQGQLNTKELSTKELSTKELKERNLPEEVIDYLNAKTGASYKANTKDTQKHIKARVAEGFTLPDFKTVIDKKASEWSGTDMEQYLRPSTLFGPKFESYLNAPARKKEETEPSYDPGTYWKKGRSVPAYKPKEEPWWLERH